MPGRDLRGISNHLQGFNLSAAARMRTFIRTSLIMSACGLMSGLTSTHPHGDRHFNVKGHGPVSISADLIAVSVKHRWSLLYTLICCEFRRGKVSEMFGPLSYTGGKCSLAVDYGVAVTHQVGNRMKSVVLIIEFALIKRR